MAGSWLRTERRRVRPVPTSNSSLAVKMRLNPEGQWLEAGSAAEIDDQDAVIPVLEFQARDHDLKELGVDPNQARVIVRISQSKLHQAEIVAEWPCSSLPKVWQLPADRADRVAWGSGVILTAAVVLKCRHDSFPYSGAWIARSDFYIRGRRRGYEFDVQRWDAAEFRRRGLPGTTTFWVDLTAVNFNDPPEDAASDVVLAILDRVYDELTRAGTTRASKAIQMMIMVEAITDMILEGVAGLEGPEPTEDSLLHALIARVASAADRSEGDVLKWARDSDRAKIRALVQAASKLHGELCKLTED